MEDHFSIPDCPHHAVPVGDISRDHLDLALMLGVLQPAPSAVGPVVDQGPSLGAQGYQPLREVAADESAGPGDQDPLPSPGHRVVFQFFTSSMARL